MSTHLHRLFGTVVAIVIASSSLPARALDDSSRAAARALVNEGAEFFQQGRFEEARRKFMDAYEVAKVPTVAVWAAQAHEKLGKLVAASELYESALLMQPNELWVGNAQQQAQDQAQEALRVLKPRIPTLRIYLGGATASEVEVTVDNVKVPSALLALERRVDPGSHVVAASRGGKSVTEGILLAEGQSGSVTLNVPPPEVPVAGASAPVAVAQSTAATAPLASAGAQPASVAASEVVPASSTLVQSPATAGAQAHAEPKRELGSAQRTWGWVTFTFGTVGLALGGASSAYVAFKRAQLRHDGCNGYVCPNDSFDAGAKEYNRGRTLATFGFVAGGLLTAAGLTLVIASPSRESPPNVGLMVGPGAVAYRGAW